MGSGGRRLSVLVIAGATAFFSTFLVGGLNPLAAGTIAAAVAIGCASLEFLIGGPRGRGLLFLIAGIAVCVIVPQLPENMILQYTCWDDRPTRDGRCTEPALQHGIEYVFPSFREMKSCKLIDNRDEAIRHDCRVDKELSVRYRYWRDVELVKKHYEEDRPKDVKDPLIIGGTKFGVFQHGRDAKGQYLFTGRIEGDHFTFTVTSSKKKRGLDAVRKIVRVRCPDDYRGHFGRAPNDCRVKP